MRAPNVQIWIKKQRFPTTHFPGKRSWINFFTNQNPLYYDAKANTHKSAYGRNNVKDSQNVSSASPLCKLRIRISNKPGFFPLSPHQRRGWAKTSHHLLSRSNDVPYLSSNLLKFFFTPRKYEFCITVRVVARGVPFDFSFHHVTQQQQQQLPIRTLVRANKTPAMWQLTIISEFEVL